MALLKTVITGTGSFIPSEIITNEDFAKHQFYTEHNRKIEILPAELAAKFQQITGIEERRYALPEMTSSDLAIIAARLAIEDSGVDAETIDQIIFAHNFGNIVSGTIQTDVLPALASRVKFGLGIKNPACVAYDLIFGCPGWLQGIIQADAFIKSGLAKTCLVIGSETLSRVIDMYDRDSMIFSDGAGAVIVQGIPASETDSGILSYSMQSHTESELSYIEMGKSYYPDSDPSVRYMKMKGRKVYEYAIKNVPAAMKDCLDKSGIPIQDVKKFFLHQANEKMDEGFIKALYKLYGLSDIPEDIMPMNIHKFGNSSVATIPTLYDLVHKGLLDNHSLHAGDVIMFASVGAGMNINAVCYRV